MISKQPPSVVLLDLNLPDSHGAETFRTVLEKAPDVPVVILSGQDDEALAIKAVQRAISAHIIWNGPCTTRSSGKPCCARSK